MTLCQPSPRMASGSLLRRPTSTSRLHAELPLIAWAPLRAGMAENQVERQNRELASCLKAMGGAFMTGSRGRFQGSSASH